MKFLFYGCVFFLFVNYSICQEYEENKSLARLRLHQSPQNRFRNGASKTTTTTTPEPIYADEEELNNDEYLDEVEEEKQQPTTTTEAPKKGIRGGVVRPFRSNNDLIEALKRRRAQAQATGHVVQHQQQQQEQHQTPTNAPAPQQSNSRNGKVNSRFSPRGRPSEQSTTTTTEPVEVTPTRNSRFRGGRRL